jgi:hypothetical protein
MLGQTCIDTITLSAATDGIPSGAGHKYRPAQTHIPPRIYAPVLRDPCSSNRQRLEASRNPHRLCIRKTDEKFSSQYPGWHCLMSTCTPADTKVSHCHDYDSQILKVQSAGCNKSS